MATLAALLERLRSDLDDVAEPRFWTDEELAGYIGEAEREACHRARLIRDDASEATCLVRVDAGRARYELDPRVLRIIRACEEGEHQPLLRCRSAELDREVPAWQSRQALRPEGYVTDMGGASFRLYPRPKEATRVWLLVERLPIAVPSVARPDECPEIPEMHHLNMLGWARYLAYRKQDADAFDAEASARAAGEFTALFGPRRDAETEELLRRGRPLRVRPHFF